MRTDTPAPRAHMDVTPFLDVLLVIIVVFLLVQMQSIWPTMYAQTPRSCPDVCPGGASLLVEVGPPDRYAINGEELPFAQFGARLREVLHAQPGSTVLLMGDSGVTYDRVISVIDASRGAGAQVIGIVPKPVPR